MDNNILTISHTDDGKSYNIKVASGTSVNEVMFAMSVAIKCFVRDGVIPKFEVATDMLNRYLTDEQFNEVKEDKNESV